MQQVLVILCFIHVIETVYYGRVGKAGCLMYNGTCESSSFIYRLYSFLCVMFHMVLTSVKKVSGNQAQKLYIRNLGLRISATTNKCVSCIE